MRQLVIEGAERTLSPNDFPRGFKVTGDNLVKAVSNVIESGNVSLFSNGNVERFEESFARKYGADYCCLTTNCTSALTLALLASEIGQGDEVILPAYTYAATMMAVIATGATPVLVDIKLNDYTIDCEKIEAAISPRTRAIMPVNLLGTMADLNRLKDIVQKNNLRLIEDCAQSLGTFWEGKSCGTTDIGCFSFGSNKTLRGSEGGAILTNDREVYKKAKAIIHTGEVWKLKDNTATTAKGISFKLQDFVNGIDYPYSGRNFKISPLLVALLEENLKTIDEFREELNQNSIYLKNKLEKIEGLHIQTSLDECNRVWCYFMVTVDPDLYNRDELLLALLYEGIPIGVHFPVPLNQTSIFKKMFNEDQVFLNAEYFCSNHLSIPAYPELNKEHLDKIVEKISLVTEAFKDRGQILSELIRQRYSNQTIDEFYAGNFLVVGNVHE